jgi:phosphatidylglycerophosphatase A
MPLTKESSDGPVLTTSPSYVQSLEERAPKGIADYAALGLATCLVGFIPLAPGTWGSAVGVGLFWLLTIFSGWLSGSLSGTPELAVRNAVVSLATLIVTISGIWAATRVERSTGIKDPGIVVIDEVAGQLLTLLLIPIHAGLAAYVSGFVVFRIFDVWKPFPVRRLERLESGLGIMADDIFAGMYGAVVIAALVALNIIS